MSKLQNLLSTSEELYRGSAVLKEATAALVDCCPALLKDLKLESGILVLDGMPVVEVDLAELQKLTFGSLPSELSGRTGSIAAVLSGLETNVTSEGVAVKMTLCTRVDGNQRIHNESVSILLPLSEPVFVY